MSDPVSTCRRSAQDKGVVMNRTIMVGIMLFAMLIAAAPVVAADNEVSLGLKLWSSSWKETVTTSGGTRTFKNGTELMAGPSLYGRFWSDWFASATYLTALKDYESSGWYAQGDKMKFERSDTDVQAGYLIRDPYNDLTVGFFVAYKMIDAPASYTNGAAGLNDVGIGTWKLYGPGLGVLAEKHLDAATRLSGSLAYLFLQQEFSFSSGGVNRFDSGGWSFDVAIAHAFTKSISADVGVKYQRFKGEMVNGNDVTDSFYGMTAGIAYMF